MSSIVLTSKQVSEILRVKSKADKVKILDSGDFEFFYENALDTMRIAGILKRAEPKTSNKTGTVI